MSTYLDATATRDHLGTMRAAQMTWAQIADATGVSRSALHAVWSQPARRVQTETAQAILGRNPRRAPAADRTTGRPRVTRHPHRPRQMGPTRPHPAMGGRVIIYIAGPMTGLPEFNYPAFREAANQLRQRGHDVLDPSRREARDDWTWHDYMRPAIADVLHADGVALLPGSDNSRGARLERQVADALGLDVRPIEEWLT